MTITTIRYIFKPRRKKMKIKAYADKVREEIKEANKREGDLYGKWQAREIDQDTLIKNVNLISGYRDGLNKALDIATDVIIDSINEDK